MLNVANVGTTSLHLHGLCPGAQRHHSTATHIVPCPHAARGQTRCCRAACAQPVVPGLVERLLHHNCCKSDPGVKEKRKFRFQLKRELRKMS